MILKHEQLDGHLQRGLQSAYLISGNEPLLTMEAADHIRQCARRQGFSERRIYSVEAGFDWHDILLFSDSMSLFAERRIVEILLPSGKAGTQGSKVLQQLVQSPTEDTLIMMITGKLDESVRRSAWYRSFESKAVCVQIWPLSSRQLPSWIRQRLSRHGLRAGADVVSILADRVEGNLLAADQEIRKLKMLFDKVDLTVDDVKWAVIDSSRHNVFQFVDMAMQGHREKLSHILGHVRMEGSEPQVVLVVLAKAFRTLVGVSEALYNRRNADQIMADMKIWRSQRQIVTAAARRRQSAYWQKCLCRCGQIDRMLKGRCVGNPWDELLQLGMKMAV